MMEDVGVVPMEITVESEIPLGAGLGSSAALSVCLAAGLTGVIHQLKVAREINLDTGLKIFFFFWLESPQGICASRMDWKKSNNSKNTFQINQF